MFCNIQFLLSNPSVADFLHPQAAEKLCHPLNVFSHQFCHCVSLVLFT
jgi:hypothetical protein